MMLLSQLNRANRLVNKIFSKVNFKTHADEYDVIKKRMIRKHKLKPTPMNIKKYLLKQLLMPIEDVPEPERTIILRAGKHDFQ